LDELQGNLTFKQAVGALRKPYASHPAVSEERQHPITTELFAYGTGFRIGRRYEITGENIPGFEKSLLPCCLV
jgi:hypothetical protein